jgi:hypothetical protein
VPHRHGRPPRAGKGHSLLHPRIDRTSVKADT